MMISFFKKLIRKTLLIPLIMVMIFGVSVFAVGSTPPSGGYTPGSELDPDCIPGVTADCFVVVSGGSSTLTNGSIFVGNALNVATAVTPSGDVTVDNMGVFTVGSNRITNDMLAGAIEASKLSLTSGSIFVGNISNVATAVTPSGDVTVDNMGVFTVGSNRITNDMLAGFISLSKITDGSNIVTSIGNTTGSIANGGSISSNVLTLSIADLVNPGMVSTTSQTIGGDKTFQGSTLFNNALTTVDSGSNGISGFRLSRMINESSNLSVGDEPYELLVDASNNVYVINLGSDNISKITPGGVVTTFATVGNQPLDGVFDVSGNMYVANNLSDTVSKITPGGVVTTYGTTSSRPDAIDIDSLGNIYTADYNSDNVTIITAPSTSSVFAVVGDGPVDLIIDSNDNVFTLNNIGNTVTKITPAGSASLFATLTGSLSRMAIDSSDNLYVTTGTSVVKITPGGIVTTILSDLTNATEIINEGNLLYITDHSNDDTVTIIELNINTLSSRVLASIFSPNVAVYALVRASGVFYVSDRTNDKVFKIDPTTNRVVNYLTTDTDGDVIFNNMCDSAFCNGGNMFGTSASIGTLDPETDFLIMAGGLSAFKLKSDADGLGSFALESLSNTATGLYSSAFGKNNTTSSYAEASFGMNSTAYTPASSTALALANRLFTIGNGDGDATNLTGMGTWADTSDAFTILKNGLTGIGISNFQTTANTELLQVGTSSLSGAVARFTNSNGSCIIDPTNSSVGCTSDIRMKKNITDLDTDLVLDKVLRLQAVNYNWNADTDDARKNIGFIAQQLEQEFPEFVMTDVNGFKGVAYGSLTPVLVESIKKLNLNIIDLDKPDKTNTWRDAIISWLGNIANGITQIFAEKITAKQELCIDDLCITKDQLRNMINSTNSSVPINPIIDDITPSEVFNDKGIEPEIVPVLDIPVEIPNDTTSDTPPESDDIVIEAVIEAEIVPVLDIPVITEVVQ